MPTGGGATALCADGYCLVEARLVCGEAERGREGNDPMLRRGVQESSRGGRVSAGAQKVRIERRGRIHGSPAPFRSFGQFCTQTSHFRFIFDLHASHTDALAALTPPEWPRRGGCAARPSPRPRPHPRTWWSPGSMPLKVRKVATPGSCASRAAHAEHVAVATTPREGRRRGGGCRALERGHRLLERDRRRMRSSPVLRRLLCRLGFGLRPLGHLLARAAALRPTPHPP